MSKQGTISRDRSWGVMRALFMVAIVGLLVPLVSTARAFANPSSGSDWSPPRTVYIPETGHSIDGVFLDFWRAGNGIANYGYPISPEHEFEGRIVQYFAYARFEYWPEDANGEVVRLGNIGYELRPLALARNQLVSVDANGTRSVADVLQMQRAWLPLDAKIAKNPNTDTWRYVPATQHSVANGFKAWWEATGESYLGNPLTEEYVLDGVTYQVFERGQLGWQKEKGVWLVPIGHALAQKYNISTEPIGQGELPIYSEDLFIRPMNIDASGAPPPPAGAPQSIVISLSQQKMWAYEGEAVVMSSLVSTGKPGFETPPGTFYILVKKEIEDMEGLIGGEYYNVPQVPDVMYFTDEGHAFHGAYWHNDFGSVRSHGCVNLPLEVATWLYAWTPIGTPVVVVP